MTTRLTRDLCLVRGAVLVLDIGLTLMIDCTNLEQSQSPGDHAGPIANGAPELQAQVIASVVDDGPPAPSPNSQASPDVPQAQPRSPPPASADATNGGQKRKRNSYRTGHLPAPIVLLSHTESVAETLDTSQAYPVSYTDSDMVLHDVLGEVHRVRPRFHASSFCPLRIACIILTHSSGVSNTRCFYEHSRKHRRVLSSRQTMLYLCACKFRD